ncbi:uncharacterized protein BCN122_I3052 [Burkholderia cenocepacia]|nr:uncharacterized protein BCN122_I3052 [Burkholderia cenocepacia]
MEIQRRNKILGIAKVHVTPGQRNHFSKRSKRTSQFETDLSIRTRNQDPRHHHSP